MKSVPPANTLDRATLAARWEATFGCPAPRHAQVAFLASALAWQAQVQASDHWRGSIGATRLARLFRQSAPLVTLSPGTRLLREWQGATHQITVLTKGFEYQGQTYSSLSAIARAITGTAWSGPLFFGLKP